MSHEKTFGQIAFEECAASGWLKGHVWEDQRVWRGWWEPQGLTFHWMEIT
jgi:hypothetical protein